MSFHNTKRLGINKQLKTNIIQLKLHKRNITENKYISAQTPQQVLKVAIAESYRIERKEGRRERSERTRERWTFCDSDVHSINGKIKKDHEKTQFFEDSISRGSKCSAALTEAVMLVIGP